MTPTTIDLAPLVNGVLIPLLAPALLGVLTWAGARLSLLLHIKLQDSQRAVLSAAVTNAIAYAQQRLAARETVLVSDQVATAVNYILPKIPGALKSLGVTPQHLAELVTAQLPPVPARPPAEAPPAPEPVRSAVAAFEAGLTLDELNGRLA